jgi:hypothetical protein
MRGMDSHSRIELALRAAREQRAEARAERQMKLAKAAAEKARQERIDAETRRRTKKVRVEIISSVVGADFHFQSGDIVEVSAPLAAELMASGMAERSTAPLRISVDERPFQTLQQRQRERLEQRLSRQLPSDAVP